MPQGKKYIYELDPKKRMDLCVILDADNLWYTLGSHMKFKVDDLNLIRNNRAAGVSPTDILLQKYSHGNHTISELFYLLFKMKYHRGLSILKSEVPEKYHRFIEEGRSFDSALFSPENSRTELSFRDSFPINVPVSSNTMDGSERSRSSRSRDSRLPTSELLQGATARLPDSKQRDILHNKMSAENEKSPLPDKHVSDVYSRAKDQRRLRDEERNRKTSNTDNRLIKEDTASSRTGSVKEVNRSLKKEKVDEWVSDMEATVRIPYKEIVAATNNFSDDSILGAGGFGKVYRGVWRKNEIAVKKLTHKAKGDLMKMMLTELKPLCRFRHDNILLVYGFSIGDCDDDTPCLVYQLMPNGSLDDRLQQKGGTPPLTWKQRFYIAEGTAAGLNYLHTQKSEEPVVHGDIKSANILLDKNMEPKLGDFGLARDGPKDTATHVDVSRLQGTRPYLPPEYLKSKQLSIKVDVYSYGVVLMEIATGMRPYDKDRSKRNLYLRNMIMDTEDKDMKTLLDRRAGDDSLLIFDFLLKLGKKCASERKNDRLDMHEVLEEFKMYRTVMKDRQKAIEILYAQREPGDVSPFTRQTVHDGRPSEVPSPIQGMPFSSYGGGSLPVNEMGRPMHFSPIQARLPYGLQNYPSYPTCPSPAASPSAMFSTPSCTPNRSVCPSPLMSPYSNAMIINGSYVLPPNIERTSQQQSWPTPQLYGSPPPPLFPPSVEQPNQSLPHHSFPYEFAIRGPQQPDASVPSAYNKSVPSFNMSVPSEAPRSCGESIDGNEVDGMVPLLTVLGVKDNDSDDEGLSAKGKSTQLTLSQ